MEFLPVNKSDLKHRNWDTLDIILVSGDAYVDHPAWASAILGRFLESYGYRVGIIAQPDWTKLDDFLSLGKPRLFIGVSAGNMDSMVNHYTADKKKRNQDLYSPGGEAGLRPDRPSIVYTNRLREAFPDVPVIIGGVEASLRRLAHYDYWADKVRRSILADSKADLLVYGMGEYSLLKIAQYLENGNEIKNLTSLPGTGYMSSTLPSSALELPAYEEVAGNKQAFSRSTRLIYQNNNPYSSPPLAQKHGERWVVINPPPLPLTTPEIDRIYSNQFIRKSHPMYDKRGGIKALESVQFSLVTHRGCFGGCAFCSLAIHQGKFIQSRSIESLVKEAETFAQHPDFKGVIPDVGAPSANMYGMKGKKFDKCQKCNRISCLYPNVCSNLQTDHTASIKLWKYLRNISQIKHIRVASGVRYDLVLKDTSGQYLRDLCKYHVGGQLKIAPEHISPGVTSLMAKPGKKEYTQFMSAFKQINNKLKKDLYLIPYFISAHPGSTLEESVELAEFLRDHFQYYPEQVQNFTPTPMTISTSMYHTGINPLNNQEVYVPRDTWERKAQRALLQYRDPKNKTLVREALLKTGRTDLIGSSRQALVKDANFKPPVGKTRRSKGK